MLISELISYYVDNFFDEKVKPYIMDSFYMLRDYLSEIGFTVNVECRYKNSYETLNLEDLSKISSSYIRYKCLIGITLLIRKDLSKKSILESYETFINKKRC